MSSRARLVAFYEHYCPDHVGPNVDDLLVKYHGDLDTLFQALVAKYGPEVHKKRLQDFFSMYNREKLESVDRVLASYQGKEQELFTALVKKYGPEPNDSSAPFFLDIGTPSVVKENQRPPMAMTFKERLVAFYTHHNPSKLSLVDEQLGRYKGHEEELFTALVAFYGEEPKSVVITTAAAPPTYEDRITAFYQKYAPEKISTIPKALEMFKNDETRLFEKLVAKYGPEPEPERRTRNFQNATSQSPHLHRLVAFAEAYPAAVREWEIERLLKDNAWREETFFARLVEEHGPEPPSSSSSTGLDRDDSEASPSRRGVPLPGLLMDSDGFDSMSCQDKIRTMLGATGKGLDLDAFLRRLDEVEGRAGGHNLSGEEEEGAPETSTRSIDFDWKYVLVAIVDILQPWRLVMGGSLFSAEQRDRFEGIIGKMDNEEIPDFHDALASEFVPMVCHSVRDVLRKYPTISTEREAMWRLRDHHWSLSSIGDSLKLKKEHPLTEHPQLRSVLFSFLSVDDLCHQLRPTNNRTCASVEQHVLEQSVEFVTYMMAEPQYVEPVPVKTKKKALPQPTSTGNEPRDRLVRFCNRYCPERLATVDALLTKYHGKHDGLMQALVKRYGPEPATPPPPPQSTAPATAAAVPPPAHSNGNTYEERLVAFYAKYNPDKLDTVDKVLEKYRGREDDLMHALTQKYGPEPKVGAEVDALLADVRRKEQCRKERESWSTEDRLTVFFEKYNPEKIPSIPKILEQYKGKETQLFEALVGKYGPEPEVKQHSTTEGINSGLAELDPDIKVTTVPFRQGRRYLRMLKAFDQEGQYSRDFTLQSFSRLGLGGDLATSLTLVDLEGQEEEVISFDHDVDDGESNGPKPWTPVETDPASVRFQVLQFPSPISSGCFDMQFGHVIVSCTNPTQRGAHAHGKWHFVEHASVYLSRAFGSKPHEVILASSFQPRSLALHVLPGQSSSSSYCTTLQLPSVWLGASTESRLHRLDLMGLTALTSVDCISKSSYHSGHSVLEELFLPQSFFDLGGNIFANLVAKKLDLPVQLPGQMHIPTSFLESHKTLVEVDIGCPSMMEIQGLVLQSCPNLKSISLAGAESLQTIGPHFASQCPRLRTFIFPTKGEKLVSLGESMLFDCPRLAALDFSTVPNIHCVPHMLAGITLPVGGRSLVVSTRLRTLDLSTLASDLVCCRMERAQYVDWVRLLEAQGTKLILGEAQKSATLGYHGPIPSLLQRPPPNRSSAAVSQAPGPTAACGSLPKQAF